MSGLVQLSNYPPHVIAAIPRPKAALSSSKSPNLNYLKYQKIIAQFNFEKVEPKRSLSRPVRSKLNEASRFMAAKVNHINLAILSPLMSQFNFKTTEWLEKGSKLLPTKDWFQKINAHWQRIANNPDGIPYKPIGGEASSWTVDTALGGMVFGSSLYGGIVQLCGTIGSLLQIKNAYQMLQRGQELVKTALEKKSDALKTRAQQSFGFKMMKKGSKNLYLASLGLIANTGVMTRAVANLVLQAGTAAQAGVLTAIVGIGTAVAAPISFCLCAYGVKRNISRIRRTSAQLAFIDQELVRLQELKKASFGGLPFSPQAEENGVNLKQREDILLFAQRRLKKLKVDNILGMISNVLVMTGAALTMAGLVSGPGAAIMGTIGCVLISVGGVGYLLTKGILYVMRRCSKTHEVPDIQRYVSSRDMKQTAEALFKADANVKYQLDSPPSKWSNGELMAFLLIRDGVDQSAKEPDEPELMREKFFQGPAFHWKRAFG